MSFSPNSSPVSVVMSLEASDLLEPLLSLMEDPVVREGVAETARLFFQSDTATVNLIPSFIILGLGIPALLTALGIPILSSLGINLTGSGSSNGGYGAPASSYGLSASGYSRSDFDNQVSYLQEQINALVASNEALTNQVYLTGDSSNSGSYSNNLIAST